MVFLLALCLDQNPHDRALGSLFGMRGEVAISLEALVYKQQDQFSSGFPKYHHTSGSSPFDTICF